MKIVGIRQKGQEGEREIAKILNQIVSRVRRELGLPQYAKNDELFQRNQNQSEVGGSDLSNGLYLDIEVKRQEQLSVNTWWKQTVESANRSGGIPILAFRQNRKPWRICMFVDVPLQPSHVTSYSCMYGVRAELNIDNFNKWFLTYYRSWLVKTS